MKIDANLTVNKVQFDQETEAHLVLGLTAPTGSVEDKRPRLCIIPLVDVSGSMEGRKLVYAKRSLTKLIEHLSPNDYCGLIDFSDDANIISKPVICTAEAKEDLKRKVGDLQTRGSTNIADALLNGFDIAKRMDLASEVILRVILFTDGNANTGPAKAPEEIVKLVESNMEGTTVSAFGYGTDVRQDMLLDVSKKGNGNYAFIENPDDALSAFGKELGGLLSTYATNLIVEVTPLAGHGIMQVVSDVDAEEGPLGQVTIKIPDILSEEVRNLVLAVKLQPQKSAFPRDVNIFEVKAGYDTLDANLRKEHKLLEAKAKVQFVKAGEHQEKPDEDLDQIVGLAQLVRAQIEAEEHAKQGDYGAAVQHMNVIADSFKTRGLIGAAAVSKGLSSRMASQTSYTSNAAYFASVSRGASRGFGGTYHKDAAEDLTNAGVTLSNAAQDLTADSFNSPSDDPLEISADDNALGMEPNVGNGSFTISGTGSNGVVGGSDGSSVIGGGGSSHTIWTDRAADDGAGLSGINPILTVEPNPVISPEPTEEPKSKKSKKKIAQKSKRW
jgi:Ca-activated chloride channel family protein